MKVRTDKITVELRTGTWDDVRYCYTLATRNMSRYTHDQRTFTQYKSEFNPKDCRIVWYRGRRFGYVEFEKKKDGWHLWDLQLSTPLRRKGLGSALLHYVEREVKKKGGAQIVLNVYKENPAVNLYKRFGYEATSYNRTTKRYQMVKLIDQSAP